MKPSPFSMATPQKEAPAVPSSKLAQQPKKNSAPNPELQHAIETAQKSLAPHQVLVNEALKELETQREQILKAIASYDALDRLPSGRLGALYDRLQQLVTDLQTKQKEVTARLSGPIDDSEDVVALASTYEKLEAATNMIKQELEKQDSVVQRIVWMNTELAAMERAEKEDQHQKPKSKK